MLQRLNTRLVGTMGLAAGGASICAAIVGFFRVASDPDELVALYEAAHTHSDPSHAVAKLVGPAIAVVGALAVSLVAAYLGRPATIPKGPHD